MEGPHQKPNPVPEVMELTPLGFPACLAMFDKHPPPSDVKPQHTALRGLDKTGGTDNRRLKARTSTTVKRVTFDHNLMRVKFFFMHPDERKPPDRKGVTGTESLAATAAGIDLDHKQLPLRMKVLTPGLSSARIRPRAGKPHTLDIFPLPFDRPGVSDIGEADKSTADDKNTDIDGQFSDNKRGGRAQTVGKKRKRAATGNGIQKAHQSHQEKGDHQRAPSI